MTKYLLKIADFITHLFPYVSKDRMLKFSCGHIIPKENLQVLTVASGPSGMKLTYNYESRSDVKLVNVCPCLRLIIIQQ
jgi:chromosome transmission fidelity protein 1